MSTRIKDTRMELLRSKNGFKRLCEKFRGMVQMRRLHRVESEFSSPRQSRPLNPLPGNLSFGKTEDLFGNARLTDQKMLDSGPNLISTRLEAQPKLFKNPFESSFECSGESFFARNRSKGGLTNESKKHEKKMARKPLEIEKSNPFAQGEDDLVFYKHSSEKSIFD